MSAKLTYLFRHTSVYNSRVKRVWTEVVKVWVTNQEVICDTVRVRPKHGKGRMVIAGSVNNNFEPLEKLMDRSLERDKAYESKERTWVIH